MENKLLPEQKPGLCYFMTLKEILNQFDSMWTEVYELFFLSGGFSFQYLTGNQPDIQNKYKTYDSHSAIKRLSDVFMFQYRITEITDKNINCLYDILYALKEKKQVMLTIHISGLSYGYADENRFRDDAYHCIHPYRIEGNNILYNDYYVPDIGKGYKTAQAGINFLNSIRLIKNCTIIYPPAGNADKDVLRTSMLNCLVQFLNTEDRDGYAFGIKAFEAFIKDIGQTLTAEQSLLDKNLIGLLFIFKYQLYTGYYFLIDAMLNICQVDTVKQDIASANSLWTALFIQLDMVMLKPVDLRIKRLQNTAFQMLFQLSRIAQFFIDALEETIV